MKPEPASNQVIREIVPSPGESARGYLRRVAAYWYYASPLLLLSLARAREGDVDRGGSAKQIAIALRLSLGEWKSIAYRRTSDHGVARYIWFSIEHRIGYGQLTFAHPRVCIECFRERVVEWKIWELTLMTTCARHGCRLIDACPKCKKPLQRRHTAIHLCSCEYDLRNAHADRCDSTSIALSAAIEFAAGYGSNHGPLPHASVGFPEELRCLNLDELLRFIGFLAMAYKQFALIQTVGPIRRAKLSEVARLTEGVGKLLADWPNNFVAFLKRSLPTQDCDKSSSVVTTYNSLYRRLYHEFALSKFDFIRQVFEQFMLEHWKWGARGVPNWLPAKSREKLAWYSTDEAATTTALSTTKIKHLVESGEVDGYVVRAGRILDYRVGKQSLRDWDTRQAALIPRLDLARLLGLSFKSIMGLADSKVIRYAPNTQTTRHFFVREDGLRLLQAFERHEVPVISVWNKATVLTLSEAKKTILEPHERFASALQAVIDGSLVPVARTKLYPGIGGYIFSAVDLQIHCRPTGSAEGFAMHLNVSQSAQYLGIGRTGVEGLISSNHLRPTGERICKGFREFQIPLTQLESFANRFVSTKSAAERLGMTTKSLVDRLRERAIPFLAVQMKREGHRTLFIPKRVADGLQLPLDRLDNAGHHQSRKEDIAA